MVERCEDFKKRRRAVESDVQKDGGPRLQRLVWRVKIGPGLKKKKLSTESKRIGNKGDESSIPPSKRGKDETWCDYYTRAC